jgi:hypothetical protein
VEEITTRDETNSICTHGSRAMASGGLSMDGPPTTLSGTGVDRMAFLQANITRDSTEFVNGAIVGDRYIFQVSYLNSCFRSTHSKVTFRYLPDGFKLDLMTTTITTTKHFIPKQIGVG